MAGLADDVAARIRDIPDFPRPGVLFKDITPVLAEPALFTRALDWMSEGWGKVDKVVGMESRGFIFGAAVVDRLQAGFAPARKRGRLPHETVGVDYALEYGEARLEMHVDAIAPGERVLIVDDLLATGGTSHATVELVQRLGGQPIGCVFLVELEFLKGRQRLAAAYPSLELRSLVRY